jgi:hypothetical protein
VRRSDETYAAWQARLDAWRRGFTGGNAEVARTLVTPAVGMPPVSPRFAPSATGERLGDFAVTGTADLPAPQVASSASGMRATGTASATRAPSPSPRPWPRASLGGSVAPGLRAPPTMEEQLAWARRRPVLEATGFDPAWGTPPEVRGLRWSPMRFLYEPAPDETGAPYRGSANRGYYRQPHQSSVLGPGRWGWRWIEVETNVPDPTRPYRVIGTAEASALDIEVNRASLDRRLLAPEGGQIERKLDLREPAPGWIPPSTPAPAIIRRPRMTDFAWIQQRDLPVGCPYPHAYLPVPRQDYVSGRWLSPDYVPSIPLPPPYDQTPWQCGISAVTEPQKKGGKGGGNVSTDFMRNWRPPQLQAEPMFSSGTVGVDSDVGLPAATGSAAPAPDATESPQSEDPNGAVAAARQAAEEMDDLRIELEAQLGDSNLSAVERAGLRAELEKATKAGREAWDRLSDVKDAADGPGGYAEPKAQGPGIPPPTLVGAPEDAPAGPAPRRDAPAVPCKVLIAVIGCSSNLKERNEQSHYFSARAREKSFKTGLDCEVVLQCFASLAAFACHLWKKQKELKGQYLHVELYGHGSGEGLATAGFPEESDKKYVWGTDSTSSGPRSGPSWLRDTYGALGSLIGSAMVRGPQEGHVLLSLCESAGVGRGALYPAGLVADRSGHVVFGTSGTILHVEPGTIEGDRSPGTQPFDQGFPEHAGVQWTKENTGWSAFSPGTGPVSDVGKQRPTDVGRDHEGAGSLPYSPSEAGVPMADFLKGKAELKQDPLLKPGLSEEEKATARGSIKGGRLAPPQLTPKEKGAMGALCEGEKGAK